MVLSVHVVPHPSEGLSWGFWTAEEASSLGAAPFPVFRLCAQKEFISCEKGHYIFEWGFGQSAQKIKQTRQVVVEHSCPFQPAGFSSQNLETLAPVWINTITVQAGACVWALDEVVLTHTRMVMLYFAIYLWLLLASYLFLPLRTKINCILMPYPRNGPAPGHCFVQWLTFAEGGLYHQGKWLCIYLCL